MRKITAQRKQRRRDDYGICITVFRIASFNRKITLGKKTTEMKMKCEV